jgi:hypothetical protein
MACLEATLFDLEVSTVPFSPADHLLSVGERTVLFWGKFAIEVLDFSSPPGKQ